MQDDVWAPLSAELDRWQRAGKSARFWLRDDDAVEPSTSLMRLLELTHEHRIPTTLAVIPLYTGEVLAGLLDSMPLAEVVLHGWSHANHASEGEKKQELGSHRRVETVLAELKAGFDRLQTIHAGRFRPVLVPPWNRIAAPLIPALGGLGIEALSVFGPEKPAPIRMINTHVDLMDWHGTRGAREPAALIADIVARLRQMQDGDGVMGFLTHHLVHDEAGWSFLEKLFALTVRHPASRWVSVADLM